MRIVYAKHGPYTDGHLAKVVAEMRVTGAPTIRCVKRGENFFALEGSHRLAAANYLGLEPKLVLEKEELGIEEDLVGYWDRVILTLPKYTFDSIWYLDLRGELHTTEE